jgi:hypothetical protein
MRGRWLISLHLAVFVAAAWQVSAFAQTIPMQGPSHIELPLNAGANGQFADFLKSRDHAREQAESYKQFQDLLKTLPKEEKERLPKHLFNKLFDKNGEPIPEAELNNKERQQLMRQLQEILSGSYGKDGGGGGRSQEKLGTVRRFTESGAEYKPQELPPGPGKANVPPVMSGPRGEGPPQSIAPPSERTTEEKLDELQKNGSSWLDKFKNSSLANSETLRKLGRKLSQPLGGSQDGQSNGFAEKVQWIGNSSLFKSLFSRAPSRSYSAQMNQPSSSSTPSLVGMDAPGRSWTVVIWIGIGIVAIAAVWKLLADRRAARTAAGLAGWRLGPWPVDPTQVTTREELIRAFEYLSLLRFGRAARSWNHRAIARRLGDQSAEAAQHLAMLYEKARYAPPADPLPDEAVRDARRDLCLLAGVATA